MIPRRLVFQLGMARAKTKTELLEATTSQWDKLQALIDSMRPEIENASLFIGADFDRPEPHWGRDKNLRDVLAHLYAWQKMLFDFVDANQNGIARPFLPAPHTWRTTPALNAEIWEHYQDTPLGDIQKMLTSSHSRIIELIESFTDEELFTKKYFPWTGTTSLGSYMVSAAPSHYDWAIKKLRAHQKANKSSPKAPK
ncbi:ClbS/DfsB family four-helix bundle protein [Arcanobacterium phocae]|uniref:ClbS/DfsB family four-helix bundle protein n=1 Tax=Arcanobacterium phocae TaxID=131112 RepID=UPI00344F34FC